MDAYDSDESGRSEIYIQSFPDRNVRVTADGGFDPRWSSDGRTLYFINRDSTLMSVPVPMMEKRTFRYTPEDVHGPSWPRGARCD